MVLGNKCHLFAEPGEASRAATLVSSWHMQTCAQIERAATGSLTSMLHQHPDRRTEHLLLTMSGSKTTASLRKRAMVVDPPKAKYPISSPLLYVLPTSAVKRMEPTWPGNNSAWVDASSGVSPDGAEGSRIPMHC